MLFYYALAASGSSFIWRFKVQAEILWVDFRVNARLRAARILLVVYTHHVTSKSRDVRIYARVVHFNTPPQQVISFVIPSSSFNLLWLSWGIAFIIMSAILSFDVTYVSDALFEATFLQM